MIMLVFLINRFLHYTEAVLPVNFWARYYIAVPLGGVDVTNYLYVTSAVLNNIMNIEGSKGLKKKHDFKYGPLFKVRLWGNDGFLCTQHDYNKDIKCCLCQKINLK